MHTPGKNTKNEREGRNLVAREVMESIGGTPWLLPCHMSLSPPTPRAVPWQAHHCGTGCMESHRRLGAGGTCLCSKHVNKSIFKWEAVGEGEPPRAGLLCCRRGLARGLEVQVQVSAFPYCFLGGKKPISCKQEELCSRRGALQQEPCRLLPLQLHLPLCASPGVGPSP